jgi:hypothetical protein
MLGFSASLIQVLKRAAPEQVCLSFSVNQKLFLTKKKKPKGGVISGDIPTAYNSKDPLQLWIIQVCASDAFSLFRQGG